MLSKIDSENPMIDSLLPGEFWQYANLGFHAIIDIALVILIIYMSGLYSPNKQKQADA